MQLVGRERPAQILRSELDRTLSSHGGLVLVSGEAGIGKTALVAEAVATAEDLGALVTTGVCWEGEGTPGFWPWTQVLRGLEQRVDAATWEEICAGLGDELSLLQRDGFTQRQEVGSRSDAGFGLSDALTTALVRLSRRQPVVVVLDDLHWADPGSLRVLEFVARHAWFEQLLVMGTYRDTEVDARDHPLRPLLQPLVAKATTVTLSGLTCDAVRLLLAHAAGREPTDEVVAEVHRRTGGNPFFVDQTARLWQDGDAVDLIPPGVRDAVVRRLGLLPGALVDVLGTGALIGQEVPRDVLAEVSGLPTSEVDELLAEAAAVRLLLPGKDGVWHFVHDIVRETLAARMDEADARKRHAAIAQALEANPQTMRDCPGVVAHHASLAVPEVAPEQVVRLLQQAAWDAMGRLALDEASTHLHRAVQLVPDDRPHQRAALCLEWGATLHSLGEVEAARARYREVADLARAIDDPEMLTRAALQLRGAVWLADTAEIAPVVTELINEAHAKLLGDGAGKTELERERELSLRAIEIARKTGDDEALMHALAARYDAIWEPGTAAEREALALEVGEAAMRLRDRSGRFFCSSLRLVALLEQGKRQWHDELATSIADADLIDSPYWLSFVSWLRTLDALVAGDFPAARAAQAESRRLDAESFGGGPGDFQILQLQLAWTTDLLQGCARQAQAHIPGLRHSGHPYPDLLAAMTAVQQGNLDMARDYYHRVRRAEARPSRWFAGLWLRFQAELAAATRDAAICERARQDLTPVADQWAVTFMDGPHGPLSLWLATVDAAQQRRGCCGAGG